MTLRSEVLSGLFWTGGIRLLSQLLTWAITIVVIRLLSPADYGLLSMATVLMSFLVLMAEAGLGTALVQAAEVDETKLRRIFGAVILIDAALFLIQLVVAPAVAYFFAEERLIPIVRVLALQYLLMIFTVIPGAMLTRKLNFRSQSTIALVAAVCGSLSTLGLAFLDHGVWSLVVGNLVTAAVSAFGVNLVAPFLKRPDFSFRDLHRLVAYGGQVTASRVLWFLYSQADILIAGKLLGKELLGFYSVSMHLASLPMQKITSVLNQVAFPAFASVQKQPDKAAYYLLKEVRIISFIAFPVFWGISSVAPELVGVLLGSKWDLAIVPLQILALIMPIRMIGSVIQTAIDGLGRPDIGLKNLILAIVIMLPAILFGCGWGLTGLSLAWGCVSPIVFLINLSRPLEVVNLRMFDVLYPMALAAFSAGTMFGGVIVARRYVVFEQQGLYQLTALVVIGVVSYLLISMIVNIGVYKEIIELRKR